MRTLVLIAATALFAPSPTLGQPDPAPDLTPDLTSPPNTAPGESHPPPSHYEHLHNESLHFTHPLVAETPSPDTKIRLDYLLSVDGDHDKLTLGVELEYAFARWISVEAKAPFRWIDSKDDADVSGLGNIELGVKLACFCLEEYGIIFGGGLEFGLPTGDDNKGIGSNNELEIEPFVDAGIKIDNFEFIGFLKFGIPINESEDEKGEIDLELGYNLSLLYHVTPLLDVILELDGEAIASGEENESVLNVTPGIKVHPFTHTPLDFGFGVSIPVTRDKEFDARMLLSVLYHF